MLSFSKNHRIHQEGMKTKAKTRMKRLLEKRRRTIKAKQRGGGEVTNVGEWIRRVQASRVFQGGDYTLGELSDPYLKLPAQKDDYDLAFDLNNGTEPENRVDIRQEGAAIKAILKDNIGQLTPSQFKDYIMEVRRSEIGDAKDIVDSLMFMVRIENKMRVLANVTPLEESPDELGNAERYPLFLWALLLNTPENATPGFSTLPEPVQPEAPAS
jgi:hypothetical protein